MLLAARFAIHILPFSEGMCHSGCFCEMKKKGGDELRPYKTKERGGAAIW
jgi:hypothetical protein